MDLPDWLSQLSGFQNQQLDEIGILPFLVILAVSVLASLFVAYLYTKNFGHRATGSQIHRAFPLLGLSITAIFICIQFSLPLSLGLLGALSIVRFRTPIKEPEEIGFIMVIIAISICCATFNLLFLAAILVIVTLMLTLLRATSGLRGRLNDGVLLVTVPESVYQENKQKLQDFLKEKLPSGRLESVTENDGSRVVSYGFSVKNTDLLFEIEDGLKTLADSVQSHVYFNRPGEL